LAGVDPFRGVVRAISGAAASNERGMPVKHTITQVLVPARLF